MSLLLSSDCQLPAWWHMCKICTSSCVVQRPFTAPNWRSSNLLETSSSIQPPINVSIILLKVGVNEIGRKSFSIVVGGCDFSNITAFAIFQMGGTSLDSIDELNKWQMGSESANAKSRRIQFGILSNSVYWCVEVYDDDEGRNDNAEILFMFYCLIPHYYSLFQSRERYVPSTFLRGAHCLPVTISLTQTVVNRNCIIRPTCVRIDEKQ